jgi:hypothetical protein
MSKIIYLIKTNIDHFGKLIIIIIIKMKFFNLISILVKE